MSKRQPQYLHVDRSTVHCREFNDFIILHEETSNNVTPDGDVIYETQEIAVLAKNIYKICCRESYVKVYHVQNSAADYICVIDDFYEILNMVHQIVHRQNTENNQTT
jgi:CRISPR/Cas system-associated protein Cas5 (RAMP superfamily)